MPKPQFRSLRVQVLLWTILPLLVVLLTFSLSGVGSHQVSMRQLVVEENANLIGVASAAIQARLDLYGFRLVGAALPNDSTPPLEVWQIDANGISPDNDLDNDLDNDDDVPAWVTRSIAAAEAAPLSTEPWVGLDAPTQRIVWVRTDGYGGRQVGSVPSRSLGMSDLFNAGGQATPIITVVDAQKQVIDANTAPLPATLAPAHSELDALLDAALAGRSGVEFIQQEGRQLVAAYAPLQGTPWAILIHRPIADLIAPFFRYEQVLPLILMAAAIISALTFYFGLSLVVRPVHILIDYATRIGQGDFAAAEQGVGGVQEIEELRQALHAMAQLLQSEQTALQDYLRDVTNTQEEERSRLARELHDETVQTLIALDHKVQLVQRGLDKHPERTREQVAELRKLTTLATQEVRRLSYGLRPLGLEELGLDSALARLAQEGCTLYRCQGEARRLAAEKELALYRIAQESLSNARRHAHANSVRMTLIYGPKLVTLGIGDDGVGFNLPIKLSDLTGNGHFGLIGMNERAQLIGGRLFCESTPGCGATVIVQAPCDDSNAPADDKLIAEVHAWLID